MTVRRVECVRFSQASLGPFLAFGRQFCRLTKAAWPDSPLCRSLQCTSIAQIGVLDRDGGLSTGFLVDRFDGGGALRVADCLVLELLECLLGGEPDGSVVDRRLSDIERTLSLHLVKPLLHCWSRAFDELIAFEAAPDVTACEPGWVVWDIWSGSRSVVQFALEVSCARAAALEFQAVPLDHDQVLERIQAAQAALHVEIGSMRCSVGDAAHLQVGMLVPLDAPMGASWTLMNGTVALARVAAASIDNQPSLIVTERITS